MVEQTTSRDGVHAFFPDEFTRQFRKLFLPLSAALVKIGVTPNTVTLFSFFLAVVTGILLAADYLWTALVVGLAMGFCDVVDGQLAKEFGGTTEFGGVLDSTVDRYTEFCLFLGFGVRYYLLGRPEWVVGCALAFFGSVMISYVKSRAEAAGFECKVGRLQRPERLTVMAFGVLFRDIGIDAVMVFLAVGTQFTALYRLYYVYRQSGK